ncbi:SDR family NAD(P)-dependent oxidoreductase [Priestia megaterium]|uniref:SDR family NAD(P)-dependent oxidoreductase n=1 Tax=Priestia megaterium TaxID=1404 RepID=UPI00336B5104
MLYNKSYVRAEFLERTQTYGRIINISSEYEAMSEMCSRRVGAYKLSKLILNGLTQLIAEEITKDIKINEVDPGCISSDIGRPSAPTTPEQAASSSSILWLATIGPEGTSGVFLKAEKQIDW